MEIGSSTQEKARPVGARNWWADMGLPGKFKGKLIDLVESSKKVGQDDPRRVSHSIKVALALALVPLIYFLSPLFHYFRNNGIWSVITVLDVFEFTAGATLSKGVNRGIATLFGGAIGVGVHYLASLFGVIGEPILIGIFVFLLAAVTTFLRFFPRIKETYDVGVVIFMLTFSLVTVSGYRVDNIVQFAFQRILTIILSGVICVIISVFLCPVWAGEDLHKLVLQNIQLLANYFEGIGGEYFQVSEEGKTAVVSDDDNLFLQPYKSVLHSKTTEEDWANFARWEPGHGRFLFGHPWKQYLKIGDLTRQCAYLIEALNSHINSWIQVPEEFRTKNQESCRKMSTESGKALKILSSAMGEMKDPSSAYPHIQNSKQAMEELKAASLVKADLQAITTAAAVVSILTKIVSCVENIAESIHELSRQAHFKGVDELSTVTPGKPVLLHQGSVKPVLKLDVVEELTATTEKQVLVHQGSVKPVLKLDVVEELTVTLEKSVLLDDQEKIESVLHGGGGHVVITVHGTSVDSETGTKLLVE